VREHSSFASKARLSRLISATVRFAVNKRGTAASLAIIVDARDFSWLAGREQISSYVRPTGSRSDFCARCGSPVPNPLRITSYYWVPAGLLDDAETVEVAAHLYTGSKASWETIPSDAPHFETVPKLSHLMELLRSPGR
jgi:hypothetical protein